MGVRVPPGAVFEEHIPPAIFNGLPDVDTGPLGDEPRRHESRHLSFLWRLEPKDGFEQLDTENLGHHRILDQRDLQRID